MLSDILDKWDAQTLNQTDIKLNGGHPIVWHNRSTYKYLFMSIHNNKRLRWSRGSVLAFSTQVRGFKPGRSHRIFKGEKILSTPSFGGEVKPSVPCRRFAACKRSLNGVEVVILAKLPDNILAYSSHFRCWDLSRRGRRGDTWWWEVGKAMASYP